MSSVLFPLIYNTDSNKSQIKEGGVKEGGVIL